MKPYLLALILLFIAGPFHDSHAASAHSLFARTNLMAWCIVPFDGKQRGPEERAAMLEELGFKRFAYDYRAQHVPTFDAELEALKRRGISLDAWWFPGLNTEGRLILDVLKRHGVKAQLWVTGGGKPTVSEEEQGSRVEAEAKRIRLIAEAAAAIGCTVGLYNHGGWFGEPENQIVIIERLRQDGITNVGIVYNQHHGHAHVDRFAELLQKMKPHLLALNLNGMTRDGDQHGKKILPLGEGDLDLDLVRIIHDSGWRGPIGILNHTDEDAAVRLRANLDGLERLLKQLDKPPRDPWAVEDARAREQLPLYQTIPAAATAELTPHNGLPHRDAFYQWTRSHGGNESARYSALTQINRSNVHQLEVAWTYRSGDGAGNIQCNPIIVRGVMFAPTSGGHVVALNAAAGDELWRFKPEGKPVGRCLTWLAGTSAATDRMYVPAEGRGRFSLDPKTGTPVETFGQAGRIKLPNGSRVAPVVFEQMVIVPGYAKDVEAFDAVTGERRWTFHTIPQPGEFGYETWDGPEKGANCWGGMALDEARGMVFVTTGSPKPDFNGTAHAGDNLFSNCLLALDARTGKRLWHFQEIRHDIWDLDLPAPPNLTTITRNGKRVDVVTAVTKLGNTLLFDRVTGKPIFPFRLRRAPTSDLPGEVTSPYQPDVELPEPFAKQEFTLNDVTDRSEEAREFVMNLVRSANLGWFRPFSEGRPTIVPNIHGGAEWTGACVDPTNGRLYVSANELPWIIAVFRDDEPPFNPKATPTEGEKIFRAMCAACHGEDRIGKGMAPPLRGLRHRMKEDDVVALLKTGRNSMPAAPEMSATDQKALLDFLFLRDRELPDVTGKEARPRYSHNGYPKLLDHEEYPGCKPPWGTLNCIDLNTGRLLWKVPLGEYAELTRQGIPKTGTENFGGAIVTAGGLVFCAGARDEKIRAFDADSGAELWEAKLPWGGYAPPATYEVDGRQFVVIAATGGGKLGTPTGDAWIAFALPKK